MKNKLIVSLLLIIFTFSIFCNFYETLAFSGEIDPKGYISYPTLIWISQDGKAEFTVNVSSSASDYNLYYQKIDMSDSTYSNIRTKHEILNNYIEGSNKTLREKEANITTLKTAYDNLISSGTATDAEKTEALNKYNTVVSEYNGFVETEKTKIQQLKNEYYNAIPSYTNSWTATTKTDNNVKLDFGQFSKKINFVLWTKIENGTNTYYDVAYYSVEAAKGEQVTISKTAETVKVDETVQLTAQSSTDSSITWSSSNSAIATVSNTGLVKGIKEGTAVITAKGKDSLATCTITVKAKGTVEKEEDSGEGWTEFSKAKFNLKRDGISKAIIEISNVTPKKNSGYYLVISSNADKTNVTSNDTSKVILLSYDDKSKTFKTSEIEKVAKYVELNQDIYVNIIEKQYSTGNEKVITYGKKLERFAEPKYIDAFSSATYMTYNSQQIITTFTHAKENNRKMQIKVGKITDKNILQKIKNKDSSGFADLLSLAKSSKGIYNQTVNADKDDFYAIEYNAGNLSDTGNSLIKLDNMEDEAYYFLYVKTDSENGKYTAHEGVTLAQADVHNNNEWYMFFYGTDDFKWADFGSVKGDGTTSNQILPNTGAKTVIFIVLGLVMISGGVSYKLYKRNNF